MKHKLVVDVRESEPAAYRFICKTCDEFEVGPWRSTRKEARLDFYDGILTAHMHANHHIVIYGWFYEDLE